MKESYIRKYGPEGETLLRLKNSYASNSRWGKTQEAEAALQAFQSLKAVLVSRL